MVKPSRLVRLAEEGRFEALLAQVVANGRPISEPVRRRLVSPGALPAVAIGLALQRACELSYAIGDDALRLGDLALERIADAPIEGAAACAAGLLSLAALAGTEHPSAASARAAAHAAIARLARSGVHPDDASVVRWLGAEVPALIGEAAMPTAGARFGQNRRSAA